jgi:hypothetical protein
MKKNLFTTTTFVQIFCSSSPHINKSSSCKSPLTPSHNSLFHQCPWFHNQQQNTGSTPMSPNWTLGLLCRFVPIGFIEFKITVPLLFIFPSAGLRLWLRGFWLWKVHGSGWVLGILDFLGYEIVIGRIWVFLGFC